MYSNGRGAGRTMSKTWTMWSLLFISAGGIGLGVIFYEKGLEEKDSDRHRSQYSESTEDKYLDLYEEWCQLSPAEQVESPWGFGKYAVSEIQEQLKREQASRLRVNIADLATGVKKPHMLADILYGKNWRLEVAKYRKKKELRDGVMATSTISLLAGLLIASGYSSRLLVRVVVKKVRGRKHSSQVENETEEGGIAVTQEEMSSETQEVAPDEEEISLFEELGDNARIEFSAGVQVQASGPGEEVEQDGSDAGYFEPSTSHSEEMDSAKFKESFRTQAEDYDRERGQFESFAEHPSQAATLMSTEPVARNLSDLTQEVSAIREFASQQQDHVRRLQDGYDWNIIKRFCLRVIRCIDNLDDRINRLTEEEIEFQGLEDVRDELIFALESSGVEQFEPELGSDYKGQEKYLEAVKERLETEDAGLSGKIAEVVRFGYKYVISDDEVRFVRSAQVKLYV